MPMYDVDDGYNIIKAFQNVNNNFSSIPACFHQNKKQVPFLIPVIGYLNSSPVTKIAAYILEFSDSEILFAIYSTA